MSERSLRSGTPSTLRPRSEVIVGLGIVGVAFVLYAVSNARFDAGRPDLFYLADAFLHGRLWLERPFGPWDNILVGDRVYVPFGPFPAIVLTPIVAIVGPERGDQWEQVIDAGFAAIDVGLCWWLLGRLGVRSVTDRMWIAVLWGFSTAIWWVTVRGGVWHTGHLIAALVTFAALIESWGRRRAWLLGLLVGAALLTRAPLAFAAPLFAWIAASGGTTSLLGPRAWPWRQIATYGLAIAPAIAFALWYNLARFGSPLESGYGLASLPEFLERQRQLGLFSIRHLAMNLDYLLLHLPAKIDEPPFLRPDGLGMSILVTSPGLLLALRAAWRSRTVIALGLTALVVLVPSLLYYGGGWLQYGYRYALDSIPFLVAIVGLAVARRELPAWGKTLIFVGVIVNAGGVYWASRI